MKKRKRAFEQTTVFVIVTVTQRKANIVIVNFSQTPLQTLISMTQLISEILSFSLSWRRYRKEVKCGDTGVQSSSLPRTSSMSLGKSLRLPEPQSSHL